MVKWSDELCCSFASLGNYIAKFCFPLIESFFLFWGVSPVRVGYRYEVHLFKGEHFLSYVGTGLRPLLAIQGGTEQTSEVTLPARPVVSCGTIRTLLDSSFVCLN